MYMKNILKTHYLCYNNYGDYMKKKNSNIGRPKGKRKDERLNILISSNMKNEFKEIVEQNGSNISVKTCELISEYIKHQR